MSDTRKPPVDGKQVFTPDVSRMLPQSPEAEQGLVCSLIMAPVEVSALMVALGITRECFHIPTNRIIAITVNELLRDGMPIEFATLATALRNKNQLESVGGPAAISALWTFIPTAANARYYAQIVLEKYTLRKILADCSMLGARCYDEQDNVPRIIEDVTKLAADIAHIGQRATKPTIADTVMKVINERQARQDNPRDTCGLSTFCPKLDAATGGLLRGNLRVVCAPPNTGKTIWLLNEVECVAVHHGMPCLVFSLEMSREKLVTALSASISWLGVDDIRDNRLTIDEERQWAEAMAKIARAPITIEKGNFRRHEMAAMIRAWKAQHTDGRLVVVDYLQLMNHHERDNRTLADEISEDARVLRDVAQELDMTLTIASQQTGETAKGSRGPEEHADLLFLLSENEVKVKKSRSGGKGKRFSITIDPDHQRIIENGEIADDAPKKSSRKPKKTVDE